MNKTYFVVLLEAKVHLLEGSGTSWKAVRGVMIVLGNQSRADVSSC